MPETPSNRPSDRDAVPADDRAPDQPQTLADDAEVTSETVATPETDGARVAEAGHGYVGRTMDDRLKSSPRDRGDGEV